MMMTVTSLSLSQMTLELLRSQHPEDLDTVKTHLDRIQSSCTEEVSLCALFVFFDVRKSSACNVRVSRDAVE